MKILLASLSLLAAGLLGGCATGMYYDDGYATYRYDYGYYPYRYYGYDRHYYYDPYTNRYYRWRG